MMDIVFLEMATLLSLLFSVVVTHSMFLPLPQIYLLFLWLLLTSTVFGFTQHKAKFRWTILLMLLPMLYYWGNGVVAAVVLVSATVVLFYSRRMLGQGSRYEYVLNLLKALFVFILSFGFKIIVDGYAEEPVSGTVNLAAPFLLVYFFSSIFVIRSVRHLEAGLEKKKIQKNNISYIVTVAVVLPVLALQQLRSSIVSLFLRGIEAIFSVVGKVSELATLLDLEGLGETADIIGEDGGETPGAVELPPDPGGVIEEQVAEQLDFAWLQTALTILVLVILVFMVFRMATSVGGRDYGSRGFVEQRESLRKEKKKKKKKGQASDGKISRVQDPIRYYYRRYLRKLIKRGVEILPTDTSLEVNAKARADAQGQEMRDIYVQRRYGGKEGDKEFAKRMEQLYKKV